MKNLEMLTPIVLFVYNRLWHTQQTVEALQKNAEAADSELIVFSDGAKDDVVGVQVDEVRQYLRTVKGFKSIRLVEQDKNLGLANSIISGVSEVVNDYGRVIVLEDDMVTSPHFLRFMNDGLKHYEQDDRVISIHAYSFPIENLPDIFFIKGANCWGWATWKRGWDLFEPDGRLLLSRLQDRGLIDRFNLFGAYPYEEMLKNQIHGVNDSWAVRWYASALLADKLTLHSGCSLLQNIGLDGSGSHCGVDASFDAAISSSFISVEGVNVEEGQDALIAWQRFLRGREKSVLSLLIDKFTRVMKKVLGL